MKAYKTLSQAINDLTYRGYTFHFNIKNDCIECVENSINLNLMNVKVMKYIASMKMSDVDDENILYAISSDKFNLRDF
jgi:hypothetical protein